MRTGTVRFRCKYNETLNVNTPPVSSLVVLGFVIPNPEITRITRSTAVGQTRRRLSVCKKLLLVFVNALLPLKQLSLRKQLKPSQLRIRRALEGFVKRTPLC